MHVDLLLLYLLYIFGSCIISTKKWTLGRVAVNLTKTYGRVSVAKKAVWCTSVLFIGTANSPFSTPYISIITRLISIKFTYFLHSIYATSHNKFERNGPSSLRDMCSWNCPIFFTFFFFASFYKSNLEPTKDILPVDWFLSNLVHL